jgi:hypothetical protein
LKSKVTNNLKVILDLKKDLQRLRGDNSADLEGRDPNIEDVFDRFDEFFPVGNRTRTIPNGRR